ncbi:hypothetical protein MUK42_33857 [Musa troglodytarum]|uniref:Uncharacterized protein n=1 Tax=Musa troglodytarum TaxID=320322 RepID=A0A9E7GXE4_9LILI|nr:hypothetical protein MUK42_33857 [Musa troglodytarum]
MKVHGRPENEAPGDAWVTRERQRISRGASGTRSCEPKEESEAKGRRERGGTGFPGILPALSVSFRNAASDASHRDLSFPYETETCKEKKVPR